jgi:hypothetical protein
VLALERIGRASTTGSSADPDTDRPCSTLRVVCWAGSVVGEVFLEGFAHDIGLPPSYACRFASAVVPTLTATGTLGRPGSDVTACDRAGPLLPRAAAGT